MLHKKFSKLDKDYIILHSKYLVDNNKQAYFNRIEKLASLGQLNAIQDFYKFRDEVKGNGYVNEKVEEHVKHFIDDYFINFEEAYALLLREGQTGDKEYVFDVVNKEFKDQFFNDRFVACVIAERGLEIYHELGDSKTTATQANFKNMRGVLKEGLLYFKNNELTGEKYDIMSYVTTLYSLRCVKNKTHLQVKRCYNNLNRLANKPLSQNYEDENV